MALAKATKVRFYDRNNEKPIGDIRFNGVEESEVPFYGVLMRDDTLIPHVNAYTNDGIRFGLSKKKGRYFLFQSDMKLTNCRQYVRI